MDKMKVYKISIKQFDIIIDIYKRRFYGVIFIGIFTLIYGLTTVNIWIDVLGLFFIIAPFHRYKFNKNIKSKGVIRIEIDFLHKLIIFETYTHEIYKVEFYKFERNWDGGGRIYLLDENNNRISGEYPFIITDVFPNYNELDNYFKKYSYNRKRNKST